MASITSSGIGSGLDVNGLVTSLMQVERQPLAVLDTKEASYQAKLSALGTLTSSVTNLQSKIDALKADSLYAKNTSSSSDATVLSANALSTARAGNYAVSVLATAKAQSISSATFGSMSTPISSIDGKLEIEIGTFTEAQGETPASFAKVSGPVVVDVSAANSSLSAIRDQINAANAGVRASIVSVDAAGTQYKLAITSLTTGAAGSIKITAKNSNGDILTNNQDIAKLSFNPTLAAGSGKEFSVPTPAQDAHLTVDGVELYRSSNTIGDAIAGVSMTLTKEGTTTLTVAKDTTSIRTAVEGFVTAYNETVTLARQLSSYNSDTQQAAVLTGDSAARNLLNQLRSMVNTEYTGSGSLKRLSDLGISVQRDGTLQINTLKLTTTLSSSTSDVAAMLSSSNASSRGIARSMSTTVESLLDDNGILNARADGINAAIAALDQQRTVLNRRLDAVEKRYRAQFTALDSLVASMQSTSQYLSQQLAALTANTKS